MKRLIIALILLLAVGGTTVFLIIYLEFNPLAEEEAPPEPPSEIVFVRMAPLVVSVFQDDVPVSLLQFEIGVETMTGDNEELVRKLIPKLRDAYLRDMYDTVPLIIGEDASMDIPLLKQRLLMISDRVAGEGVVSSVLILSIVDTPNE